mmetsp:Transcript_23183/g.64249  ORF Transcript_23183/g.64249 Transcript_23183/m.64249 type:complete len:257 (-) Transcript_23183:215-985(-)
MSYNYNNAYNTNAYNNNAQPSGVNQNFKKTLKIVILGDSGVGKTSLMNQFSTGKFTGQYKATIGADFLSKDNVIVNDNFFQQRHLVTLQIWDTAGQERFQSLGVGFYRGADACLLVYDITDPHSLDNLDHWRKEFLEQVGGGIQGLGDASTQFPFVVVGNKMDKINDRLVTREQAEDWCRTAASATIMGSQPLPHFECSAKTSESVEDAFQEAARRAIVYEEYKRRSQPQLFIPPPEPINLREHYGQGNDQPKQCC